ncbi:MAG: peptide ABC transporter substrate-binding protein [Bacteroidota bacterium]
MAGEGEVDADALARAEAALAALDGDYLRWVQADVTALAGALAALRQSSGPQWQPSAERLYAIAHDIKGQGATFGYPLMSTLAQALCGLIVGAPGDRTVLARLGVLVAAMTEVVSTRLSGDGGQRGRDLLASLRVGHPDLPPGH